MNRFLARIALRGAGMGSVRPSAPVADQGLGQFEEVVEEVRGAAASNGLTTVVRPEQTRIDPRAAATRADGAGLDGREQAVTRQAPVTPAVSTLQPAAAARSTPPPGRTSPPASPAPLGTAVTPSVPALRRSPLPSPAVSPAAPAPGPRSAVVVEASPSATIAARAAVEGAGAGARRKTSAGSAAAPGSAAKPADLGRLPVELGPVAVLRPQPESTAPVVRVVAQDAEAMATAPGHSMVPPAEAELAAAGAPDSRAEPPGANGALIDEGRRPPITAAQAAARPVEVRIGRIEVVQPASPAPSEPAPAAHAIGFDEYARARANGF